MFFVSFTISFLIFSNAIECVFSQLKIYFLFKSGRNGFPRVAKLGTNLINWFIEPKKDLNFL